MQEGKRQKQVAAVLKHELNDIFVRLGMNMLEGGMVSIANVKVTPDLLEARIYLSLFQVPDAQAALKKIESRAWEVKRELSERVKSQLRRIPVLHFYLDDTLDYVFRMEDIFRKIQAEGDEKAGGSTGDPN